VAAADTLATKDTKGTKGFFVSSCLRGQTCFVSFVPFVATVLVSFVAQNVIRPAIWTARGSNAAITRLNVDPEIRKKFVTVLLLNRL